MSDLVDPTTIEGIVGVPRHPTEHWGRADSVALIVYVLHSGHCRDTTPDLRDCPYSQALDQGIENETVWPYWHGNEDRPVRLAIHDGHLRPDDAETNGATT